MSWFNYYGLIFIVLIMLPNIVYSIKNKIWLQTTIQTKSPRYLNKSEDMLVWLL